jgi:hypothetical protein
MAESLATKKPNATALVAREDMDDLVADAGRGVEQIGPEDVRPPRLLICQAGSPQRKPDDPKQIHGLQELDMFNDLSGEIYGRGPLNFVIISSQGHRHIEFAPMDQGGGVIDFNVPDGDPRTEFTTNEQGERVRPVATKFYDYLAWLTDKQELVVISMKSTQIKVAVKLNGLLKLPLRLEDGRVITDPPAWARTYAIETRMDKDKNYSWGGFNLRTIGITPTETRLVARKLADSYAGKRIVIEVDEQDAHGAESTEGPVSDEPPPF